MRDDRQYITAGFEIQKSDLPYGEIEVIVSNSGIDRHGESIVMEGINLSEIRRNPVVLWAHDYSSLPIGQITKLWKSSGNLMARIKLANEVYDFADKVYKLVKAGVINAVSIGGIVKEWSEDFLIAKKMDMVELSIVPVGAHPDALVVRKSLGVEQEDLKNSYEDFILRSLSFKTEAEKTIEPCNVRRIITLTV